MDDPLASHEEGGRFFTERELEDRNTFRKYQQERIHDLRQRMSKLKRRQKRRMKKKIAKIVDAQERAMQPHPPTSPRNSWADEVALLGIDCYAKDFKLATFQDRPGTANSVNIGGSILHRTVASQRQPDSKFSEPHFPERKQKKRPYFVEHMALTKEERAKLGNAIVTRQSMTANSLKAE